jgi:putative protease
MELLAPAGNYEKFKMAMYYGADAVYLAGKTFGLRAFAGNFSNEEIKSACTEAHSLGKKVYVTINIIAKDEDFVGLDEYLKVLQDAKVDGVIVADIGLIYYIRQNAPSLDVHVSTQANVINSMSAKFFADMGVKRIVLARELTIDQIKNIRKNLDPKVEIEAFVHGAMCISYSGRCLLSNYLTGRDANHGECVQCCRWKYMIREVSRENENEVQEDERGTYIFNSKDMNLVRHLQELKDAGVDSLKIEGRMKSAYYVATVVNAYRKAIDMLPNSPSEDIITELEKTSHRRYTTGFMFGADDKEFLEDSMPVQTSEFVGVVLGCKDDRLIIEQRNNFKVGAELEVLSPNNDVFKKRIVVEDLRNENGESISVANVAKQVVSFKANGLILHPGDILRR